MNELQYNPKTLPLNEQNQFHENTHENNQMNKFQLQLKSQNRIKTKPRDVTITKYRIRKNDTQSLLQYRTFDSICTNSDWVVTSKASNNLNSTQSNTNHFKYDLALFSQSIRLEIPNYRPNVLCYSVVGVAYLYFIVNGWWLLLSNDPRRHINSQQKLLFINWLWLCSRTRSQYKGHTTYRRDRRSAIKRFN